MQASVLLLHWGSYRWARNLLVLIIYFSSLLCCPLCFQGSPQTRQQECFLVLETSLFLRLPSQDRAPSLPLLSLFFVFYIFSYLFLKTMSCFSGYLIVLYLDSEVVLWNLLSVEMFFWWICGGESGLPVLFLRHLRTTSCFTVYVLVWFGDSNVLFKTF